MTNDSAYGAGSPTYQSAESQQTALTGRLEVARGIRDRAPAGSHTRARWSVIVDELLDRLLEVRGR